MTGRLSTGAELTPGREGPPLVRRTGVRPHHLVELARTMRPADVREVRASGGYARPVDALLESVAVSEVCETGIIAGGVAAVYGVAPAAPGAVLWFFQRPCTRPGGVWALTSTVVDRHPIPFAAMSRRVMREWLATYDLLFNFVDQRNERSLRWLSWLGFEIQDALPWGPQRRPFHPVVRVRPEARKEAPCVNR